ncbi:catabolic L-serine/threonine dehydratase [Coemansia sp. RSA 1290]|nr:catabolic L-serine/threonine dehydratase [Coemansia sp. RSA 1821]KAJ2631141.1 catabolic L-serine/threonine dehydratase [Coemansia sp. RSA 1290]KAJ2649441.1 catabolic L-serine/threonine dehydratase [Coemansia sp. RSA 1250]
MAYDKQADSERSLHTPTPLLYSASMSRQAGCNVWLKLENMQPTQSFKIRGIGNLCAQAVAEQSATHLVAVGDTNTALAVAYSARQLGVPATIYVSSNCGYTPPIRAKAELEDATIVEHGRTLKEAYIAAREFVDKTAGACLIDSADDPAVIAGYATIASEINIQLQRQEPAAIVTTVGSGALLSGLITGLQRCQWQRVPMIAVETHNTNSFQQALLADSNGQRAAGSADNPSLLPPLESPLEMDGDIKPLKSLSRPTSRPASEGPGQTPARMRFATDQRASEPTVATCLLAGSTCASALELTREHPVVPLSITEAMAVEACRRLLDEHQLLVEIGSAAALSVVGKGLLHQIVPALDHRCHVVVVVTGGANINFERLEACRQRFPYPAPIIAKSGQEIFMRMLDSALPSASGDFAAAAAAAAAAATAVATAASGSHETSAPTAGQH